MRQCLTEIETESKSSTTISGENAGPKYSRRQFEKILQILKSKHEKNSTQAAYHKDWIRFNNFFIKLDDKPLVWEDRLVLYMTYLINTKRCQSSTIRMYRAGIKHCLALIGVHLSEDLCTLTSLLKNEVTSSIKLEILSSLISSALMA